MFKLLLTPSLTIVDKMFVLIYLREAETCPQKFFQNTRWARCLKKHVFWDIAQSSR